MSMEEQEQAIDLIERLRRSTVAIGALAGPEGLSLRAVAAQSGCSTGYIFQHLGNKNGLLQTSVESAILHDAGFHDDLLHGLGTLDLSLPAIADLASRYIRSRARQDESRFLLWCLLSTGDELLDPAMLARWHGSKVAFWGTVLDRAGALPDRAPALAAYVMMEELYATALPDDVLPGLLLDETIRAFLRRPGIAADAEIPLALALDEQPRRPPANLSASEAPVRERLVRAGADDILKNGIGGLNQRRAARIAQASPSAITYHFGDMESFINEAIWNAMIRDIPRVLDPDGHLDGAAMTLEQWLAGLAGFLQPKRGEGAAGFYTNFARMVGETCLLVATRPALHPLVLHLRSIEGWATFRASRHVTVPAVRISRDQATAFALWIKGEAILRNSGVVAGAITSAMLVNGAGAIFSGEQSESTPR